ncbi:hypothetical protein MNBD_CHLOROFLEXI01-4275 [hydrothermal vent metagenome]|uniref:Helix-hairpin-helix DNA-binding motif class 1 domain-containing protein n=1 Tax=hydrothermal vent metagenome TaxID=652676 RepID=A0A3B0VIB1_9ZZZZ
MRTKIDINSANAETLTTISGIGPALAQRIIEYRETVHPFEEVIELTAVPGISEKMVRSFADRVTVSTESMGPGLPETARTEFVEDAVSSDGDDLEETPLLTDPEPVALLEASEQPEALLAAKMPEVEEIIVDEDAPNVEEIATDVDAAVESELVYAEDGIGGLDTEELLLSEEMAEPNQIVEEEEVVQTADFIPTPAVAEPIADPEPVPSETAPLANPMQAVPQQPPINWEAKARRRGCLSTLLGATFGAILGAVLTLAVLASLNNGTLNYAAPDAQIRQQLDTEIISRTNELNSLSTRVSVVATAEAEANQTLQADFEAANEDIAKNEEIISILATRSGDLALRLRDVAGAADTFNNFLDGLSSLLTELDADPTTPVPSSNSATRTPSPTPRPPTPTPLSLTTPLPTPTTAVQPTRTPQPTATPFTFPTTTPAPQP